MRCEAIVGVAEARLTNSGIRLRQSSPIHDLLLELGCIQSYPAQHALLQNRGSPSIFFVVSGKLVSESISASGRQLAINTFEAGDLVGLELLAETQIASDSYARLVAIEDSEVVRIETRDLETLLQRRPDFCYEALRVVLRQFAGNVQRLRQLMCYSLGQRLAILLLAHAKEEGIALLQGANLRLPMSQKLLAETTGASREAVNRELHKWASLGVIRMNNPTLTILNVDKLIKLATGECHGETSN
jgi:CRP-like cAMP-binding protein